METNTLLGLPPVAGDLIVEVIGPKLRFWELDPAGKRINRIAESMSLGRRFGRVLSTAGNYKPAADLTPDRVYGQQRATAGELIRRYFPNVGRIHCYYQGHGPSGHHWQFRPDAVSHFTIEGEA